MDHKLVLLTATQRDACKTLRNNEDILIRKTDKPNIYVMLNHEDFKNKLDDILKDKSKSQIHDDQLKISRNN